MLRTPVIVLNMKTYSESTGENALDIAKIMDRVSIESGNGYRRFRLQRRERDLSAAER